MRVLISADHRGISAARHLFEHLRSREIDAELIGPSDGTPCDYPERAFEVGSAVARGDADAGVLVCGTGIGMSIAANKVRGVRAAVVHDELTAQLSKTHNNANIVCLSADLLGHHLMDKIVDAWLDAEFQGGRHARRIGKIEAIERGENPSQLTG